MHTAHFAISQDYTETIGLCARSLCAMFTMAEMETGQKF